MALVRRRGAREGGVAGAAGNARRTRGHARIQGGAHLPDAQREPRQVVGARGLLRLGQAGAGARFVAAAPRAAR